jgi:hypothetical protein
VANAAYAAIMVLAGIGMPELAALIASLGSRIALPQKA